MLKLSTVDLRTIVGVVELVVKPAGNVTVMVPPPASAPVDDAVKPTVHVEAVLATSDVGAVAVKVTAAGDDAPAAETAGTVTKNDVARTTFVNARTRLRTTDQA